MKTRISIAFAALLIATAAFTQPALRPVRRMAVISAYLQLTPDQIAAWKQINQETAAKIRAERRAANEKRMAVLTPEQKQKLQALRDAR
jgi:Spy/CpxP family protein refolding chaperone